MFVIGLSVFVPSQRVRGDLLVSLLRGGVAVPCGASTERLSPSGARLLCNGLCLALCEPTVSAQVLPWLVLDT